MNWRLILILSTPGVVMGVAAVWGLTQGREAPFWLAIGLVTALLIARKAPGEPFQHGLLAGIFTAVVAGLIQVTLFDTYLANNDQTAASLDDLPMSPRLFFLFVATPIVAVSSWGALGAVSWLISKLFRKKPVSTASA